MRILYKRAAEFRKDWQMRTVFVGLQIFMTMKSEKLANMRTVEEYLQKKSREKVL